MIRNLPNAAGYSDSKGLFAARKAVMHYTQQKGIAGVTLDDIYLGNGASELIAMATNALLDDGDEVLVPAPDYPLWTAAAALSGGTPVHYLCDEAPAGCPTSTTSAARSRRAPRRIVVINPNNPTGALYPDELLKEIVEIARQHQLIVLADEIYDKVLYDGASTPRSPRWPTTCCSLTFNGLSKNYRSCGYRAGWMVVSGDKKHAEDYIEGLNMLAIDAPVRQRAGPVRDPDRAGRLPEHQRPGAPGGRLRRQRDLAYELITRSPASPASSRRRRCTCSRASIRRSTRSRTTSSSPRAAAEEKVLLVQGTGFNWPQPDHFRIVFLPNEDDLREAVGPHRALPRRYTTARRHSNETRSKSACSASAPWAAAPSTSSSATRRRSSAAPAAASRSPWSPTSTRRAPRRSWAAGAKVVTEGRARDHRQPRRSTSSSS